MLGEGTDAPTFALPGVVDGAPRDVDISDYVGNGILVLAFYPADFSPACGEDSCDLTELDLFTMQQDVDIFAISPDSVFSHRQFAEEYSLSVPLLSDTHGEAMDAYDVRLDSDQLLAQRAVFVVDQEGVVQYAWATEDMEERPDVDAVREAVSSIGGDSTAVGRYRVGHAHYMEGRRAFTSAMGSYEDRDWLIAQGDFERAMEEFQEAADQFQSAVRFAESGELEFGFTRAQEKATSLWQAAEWLADSASAYASGDGEEGDNLRQDAESPLETARDIGEPPDPDDITLDPVPADDEGESGETATEATTDADDAATDDADAGADDLAAPTDPAEDEASTAPSVEEEGDDEDIDAAVQEVEGESPSAATADEEPDEEAVTVDEEDVDAVAREVEAATEAAQDDAGGDPDADASDPDASIVDEDAAVDAAVESVDETVDGTVEPNHENGSEHADTESAADGERNEAGTSEDDDASATDGDGGDVELDLNDPDEQG